MQYRTRFASLRVRPICRDIPHTRALVAGYMSAPHTYVTDRLCVVISGIWWCNSGDDFDPASCVPVPAGSYVRRVAGTSHYDGVIRDRSDPAIIAICGMGPVGFKLVYPSKPGWRAV